MDNNLIKEIQSLKEENAFLTKLIKEAPVSIHINKIDKSGHNLPVWANDKYEKMSGYTIDERKKIGFADTKSGIYHKDDLEAIQKAVKIAFENKDREESIIFRYYRKNGELRWIYVQSKAIIYQKDPNHILSIGFDVTGKLVLNQEQLEVYMREIAQLKNQIKICKLTKVEKEIIKELVLGKTTKQIAELRNRSYETINNHKRNIFKKLEINKINELVAFAKETGIA